VPNTATAKKRNRQADTRRTQNRGKRSALRTAIKNVRAAETPEKAHEAYRAAEQLLDRAAQKHLIHANLAARTKSRLQKVIQAKS
jgi:small subunit ribosomal protein S20